MIILGYIRSLVSQITGCLSKGLHSGYIGTCKVKGLGFLKFRGTSRRRYVMIILGYVV